MSERFANAGCARVAQLPRDKNLGQGPRLSAEPQTQPRVIMGALAKSNRLHEILSKNDSCGLQRSCCALCATEKSRAQSKGRRSRCELVGIPPELIPTDEDVPMNAQT